MSATDLAQLFAYNAYANRLVLDVTAKMTEEELDRQASPSHGTVRTLLLHMLESDAWFLSLCKGESWQEWHPFASLAEMRAHWEPAAAGLEALAAAQSAETLARRVRVQFGEYWFEYSIWELLMQTFQHATHHRGELSSSMSALGYPLPTLDILLFFTDQSGQHWPFRR